MTTPPRGEADEPAPIRETGLGWPDQPPPASAPPPPAQPPASVPPPPPSPPLAQPQPPASAPRPAGATAGTPRPRGGAGLTDPAFAEAVRQYRAGSSHARPAHPYPVVQERPGTVTAAAVILFVSAGLGLLACCGINLLAGGASLDGDEQTVLLIFSAVIVVVSGFNGLLGYFVLQGRQWARVTTIVLCALGIAGAVIGLMLEAGTPSNALSTCFGLVLNVVVIVLLSGERAGDYFRPAHR